MNLSHVATLQNEVKSRNLGHFPVKRRYGCEDLGIRLSEGFIFAWPLGFCQSLEGKLLDQ